MNAFLDRVERQNLFEQIDVALNFPPFAHAIRVWGEVVEKDNAVRAWHRHVFATVVRKGEEGNQVEQAVAVDERLPEKCDASTSDECDETCETTR